MTDDLISKADAIEVATEELENGTFYDIPSKIKAIPSAQPKTEEFEWCTDCKEYDQENHCCHRWTKQIRKTIAEIEEDYKPKHGEWIKDNLGTTICSECKRPRRDNRVNHINFCNSCGAKMKGADDE